MSIIMFLLLSLSPPAAPVSTDRFAGRYFSGAGDVEYLELLDISRRMFSPDPEFQNVPMLYRLQWNGLVEGPTWGMWWIQNSYGPTFGALPFYDEPLITFLQNSQNLWFDQMGDGRTVRPFRMGSKAFDWIPPDGCLCDAARPGKFIAKQGDGRAGIHDWGFEFTAAGLLMQAELLLISRDREAINHYLPKLQRCANFIETRRDPENDLFLVGPATNLLAPSYAGWKRPDGTYDKAYLTGLSVTYVAALDRLIDLYKLVGDTEKAALNTTRRDTARAALSQLTTDEGYFIKYLDPDGTRHGVYGADKHGYFESSPNHDAIAHRVVDDRQAEKIYVKIASIDGLRPHDLILANYPGLDDMYEEPQGLWRFGHWVNGGHWSTCEARMILAYYRLGKFEDARRSMKQLLTFARQFRMDNPLIDFGRAVYQPKQPINLCYDSFGPPAAMIRGLFEYRYAAEGLTLFPHIPPGITELHQHFPIRFGDKRLYLATAGTGPITRVFVNGSVWDTFTADSVFLPYDRTAATTIVEIIMDNAPRPQFQPSVATSKTVLLSVTEQMAPDLAELCVKANQLLALADRLDSDDLSNGYEAAHARLAAQYIITTHERLRMLAANELHPLPEPSATAADRAYLGTARDLQKGLIAVLDGYAGSDDAHKQRIYRLWQEIRKAKE